MIKAIDSNENPREQKLIPPRIGPIIPSPIMPPIMLPIVGIISHISTAPTSTIEAITQSAKAYVNSDYAFLARFIENNIFVLLTV